MEQVSPTRTELLTKRSQIALAEQGAKLLRGKREALVREFLAEIRTFKADRDELLANLAGAGRSLVRALYIDTPEAVRSVALATSRDIHVEFTEQNIWGTRVVNAESAYHVRHPDEREYSLMGASARTSSG